MPTIPAIAVEGVTRTLTLDRRYELGVLKAVGYTRRQLLTTLLIEYGPVADIASSAALIVLTVIAMMCGPTRVSPAIVLNDRE